MRIIIVGAGEGLPFREEVNATCTVPSGTLHDRPVKTAPKLRLRGSQRPSGTCLGGS